jgi:predicted  nucleic acid-binding Zn-ribbon protein
MSPTKYLLGAFASMILATIVTAVGVAFFPMQSSVVSYLHIIVFFASGFVPLLIYYLQLHRIQAVGRDGDHLGMHLTDIEVDSIYYLGFLITLMTLVFSVGSLFVGSGNVKTETIIGQFSLGLVVTGFALWGRLDLQQNNEKLSDPDSAMDQYVNKMERVVSDIDTSYSKLQKVFSIATDNFQKSSEQLESFSGSFATINREMQEASESIGEGMSAISSKSKNIDDALDSLLALSSHVTRLDTAINELSASIGFMNKSGIDEVVKSIETSAKAISDSSKKFEKNIVDSSNKVNQNTGAFVSDMERSTAQLSSALQSLSAAMVGVANKVTDSLRS